jgi:hypothetical protein
MIGTNCDLFTHNQSRSYLNYLVHPGRALCRWTHIIKVYILVIDLFVRKEEAEEDQGKFGRTV